ncbi:uncharacterized protein LOC133895969 [Phragmites australis]|uniref:uncharacterized protein LOC133895969 n=1 Tax=Phragmites australis TaxID=29695 RepID=UPI002D783607|nr:uncharacterized protein LOC133895969 [Phragmites australis]
MSFRRFLYLVADDYVDRSYSLRRIDMSRLFFRPSTVGDQPSPTPLDSSGGAGAADPSATEDGGRLPDPTMILSTPDMMHARGSIHFMPFKNKGSGEHCKVFTMDHTGRALMCDPGLPPAFRHLPSLASGKAAPFSLTVGDSLYIMDAFPKPPGPKRHSFEVLTYDEKCNFKESYWHTLHPPPYVYDLRDSSQYVESYALVAGSNMVISNKAVAETYCFDTVKSTWRKAGDWALPFTRLAEYDPDHKLWFGISSYDDGYRFCGANLIDASGEMRPPVVHGFWKEYVEPPPEWSLAWSYAVPLGSSKFCIIRLFEVVTIHVCSKSRTDELQAVLTGVEVQSCGEELRVVKHKSERYKLDITVDYRVL